MNNKIKIILFVITALFVLIVSAFGLSKVKVDDFHKAAIVFVVDASASNQKELPIYAFKSEIAEFIG